MYKQKKKRKKKKHSEMLILSVCYRVSTMLHVEQVCFCIDSGRSGLSFTAVYLVRDKLCVCQDSKCFDVIFFIFYSTHLGWILIAIKTNISFVSKTFNVFQMTHLLAEKVPPTLEEELLEDATHQFKTGHGRCVEKRVLGFFTEKNFEKVTLCAITSSQGL